MPFIKPMLSAAVRPVLKPIVRAVRQALSFGDDSIRYFTTLDSVAQSYINLSADVILTGDFEINAKVVLVEDQTNHVFGNRDNYMNRMTVFGSGQVSIRSSSKEVVITNIGVLSPYFGKLVNIRLSRKGELVRLFLNDVPIGSGVMEGLFRITQLGRSDTYVSPPSAFERFTIEDAGSLVLDLRMDDKYTPTSNFIVDRAGNNSATFVNVSQSDSYKYTLDDMSNWVTSELISGNGTFAEGSGWVDNSVDGGEVRIEDGAAIVTGESFATRGDLQNIVRTIKGAAYKVAVTVLKASGSFLIIRDSGEGLIEAVRIDEVDREFVVTFTALSNSTEIFVRSQGGESIFSNLTLDGLIELSLAQPNEVRHFTNLDSVAQSYVSLNEAVDLGVEDYSLSVDVFYTGKNVVPIGASSGRYPRLRITDSGSIEFSPTLDGFDSIERNPSNLTYGVHNIRATKVGQVTKIFVDGIQAGEDGAIVSEKGTSFNQIGRSSNFLPTGGLFFNIAIEKAGLKILSLPLDGSYTPAQNVVLDNNGVVVGEVVNVGAEDSVLYERDRLLGLWVSDSGDVIKDPHTTATRRNFTPFNNVAQSYVQLDENINIGTEDWEAEFTVHSANIESQSEAIILGRTLNNRGYIRFSDGFLELNISPNGGGPRFTEVTASNGKMATYSVRYNSLTSEVTARNITKGQVQTLGVIGGNANFNAIARKGTLYGNGAFFNVKIWVGGSRETGTLLLDIPLDQRYTSDSNDVYDATGVKVGEFVNVGSEDSTLHTLRDDGVWVGEDLQSIIVDPEHPRQVEPESRHITRFDKVAQSHIRVDQWVETSGSVIGISAVFSTSTTAQDNIVGLYNDDAMEAIGIRVDGGGYLKFYSSGFTPGIGTTFVADERLHRVDVLINKVSGLAAVFLDGKLEYTTTHTEPQRFMDQYMVSIGSRVKAIDGGVDSYMNGCVMSVKVTDDSNVRLDMALDGIYEEQGAVALSTTSVFGDEQFKASRVSGGFTQTEPNVFEKLSEGGGDLGEYYVENPLESDTLYRVQFVVESGNGSTVNIFTRGESSNTATISGIPEGQHDLIVRTGAGGGLWFARSAFVGVIRDISIRKVEGPVGYAVNTAVGDSLHFTYEEGAWVSENMTAVTYTEVLGDDANPEYAFMGVSTQELETYRLSATSTSYAGTTDSGWTGNGSGIPTSRPFRSGAQNVGDIVGGEFTATGTGSLGLYGRDNGRASYTDIQINKILKVS